MRSDSFKSGGRDVEICCYPVPLAPCRQTLQQGMQESLSVVATTLPFQRSRLAHLRDAANGGESMGARGLLMASRSVDITPGPSRGSYAGAEFTPGMSKWPASTGNAAPVMEDAMSELRKSVASAIVSGGMKVVALSAP